MLKPAALLSRPTALLSRPTALLLMPLFLLAAVSTAVVGSSPADAQPNATTPDAVTAMVFVQVTEDFEERLWHRTVEAVEVEYRPLPYTFDMGETLKAGALRR